MPIPSQPLNLIPRPFAADGTFMNIPDTTTAAGRASFSAGFPAETQLPLRQGGLAPNRTDFNGLFNLLTAFGFWQQSGGVWTYSTALNYKEPNIVFFSGALWWCIKENGPDSANGEVTPGTNEAYWMEVFKYFGLREYVVIPDATPVGSVIMFPVETPPDGYFACNGASFSASSYPKLYALLGSSILPDMRGYFVRGYDTRNTVDPEGASRAILSVQGDAIRNITGTMQTNNFGGKNPTGAFAVTRNGESTKTSSNSNATDFSFDASRVVPTAEENRPKNISLLYCIKHD